MKYLSYFFPIDSSLYSVKDKWHTSQIGYQIDSHIKDYLPNLVFAEIAIFNINEYEGTGNSSSSSDCKIRDSFYRLYFEELPKVVDLGSLQIMSSRKDTFKIVEDICADLIHRGVIPIIIGGGHDLTYAVYKSYAKLERPITVSIFDSIFNIGMSEDKLKSTSFLSKIIAHKPNYLFNTMNVGYQSFFVKPEEISLLEDLNYEIYRLGYIRNNMHELEPILRNTDFVSLDMSCVKSSDFISNIYSTPNGFNSEEICRLSRYAGISDKSSSFGIFEYNQDLDLNNQGSQLISQIIWYFLSGYKARKQELNPNLDNCTKYTVAFDDEETEIEFYKSNLSGRWWMAVPFKNDDGEIANYYIACTYNDYVNSNQGEIPYRWKKTYKRLL